MPMTILTQPAPIVFPNSDPGQVAVREITLDGVDQPAPTAVSAAVPFTFGGATVSAGIGATFQTVATAPQVGTIVNDSPTRVLIEATAPIPINGFNDRWTSTITVTTL